MKALINVVIFVVVALAVAIAGLGIADLTRSVTSPIVAANEALATRCIATGDGRVLKTVFLGSNPYVGRSMSGYTPARLLTDEKTGERRIVGTIYTIDGRKIEWFNANKIKIVDCPA